MKDTYYFIAIGGIGMSGLAKYLVEAGFTVLGSDIKQNRNIVELEKLGAKIFIGHDADNLPEKCIVVASTAIKEDNPELLKAKELGLEILHRSDLLAKISKGLCNGKKKYFLGYSGTHGKTTTSGLASYVLEKAGLNPSFIVGGIVPDIGINSNAGNGDFFIAELDESDGTIVKYQPEISIINNLEVDHIDFYKDGLQEILDTFKIYLNDLPDNAKVLINNDNEGNRKLIEQNSGANFITFGLNNADYIAKNINLGLETTFDIFYKGKLLTNLKTQMLGEHNVYNATAVLASLNEAGINLNLIKEHFYTFTGMGRRFQLSAKFDGITVYDDYAHHPTEIKATLSAAKILKNKNIIAVFQPHRYSRFAGLWDEFLNAFEDAGKVFITDIYAASEKPVADISSGKFTQELLTKLPCEHLKGTIREVAEQLLPKLKPDDIVIGLGAGTITTLGKDLLDAKTKRQEVGWAC
ncbi:MAG: UDP-N-acetylmuramate--L-alanine ligase [Candidatus Gastranaerophilales bacterium]|nr:UDP-N-acetylmuramate--L-alanine ligase [Candidatus Gastranaerophilales bacterium]